MLQEPLHERVHFLAMANNRPMLKLILPLDACHFLQEMFKDDI